MSQRHFPGRFRRLHWRKVDIDSWFRVEGTFDVLAPFPLGAQAGFILEKAQVRGWGRLQDLQAAGAAAGVGVGLRMLNANVFHVEWGDGFELHSGAFFARLVFVFGNCCCIPRQVRDLISSYTEEYPSIT